MHPMSASCAWLPVASIKLATNLLAETSAFLAYIADLSLTTADELHHDPKSGDN
jgi:hypothetical protein